MPVDILAVLRDVLVVGYLFILRIGVPLLITVMLGAWLRRLLEEKEPVPEQKPVKEPRTKQVQS